MARTQARRAERSADAFSPSRLASLTPQEWARTWRMAEVARVAGIVVAVVLVLLFVRDGDTRNLALVLSAGVYLPVSFVLFLIQQRHPQPPNLAWLAVTTADIAILAVVQALLPSLSPALIGFPAIVLVSAVLIGTTWTLVVAGAATASLITAVVLGREPQPASFAVAFTAVLLVGMAYVLGRITDEQRRLADRSHRLAMAVSSVASSMDLAEALQRLCASARESLSAMFSVVLLLEDDQLVFGGGSGQPPAPQPHEPIKEGLPRDPRFGGGPTARALATLEPADVADIERDPSMAEWRDISRGYGFRSLVAVPLHHEGVALGVLNVYLARPHQFREDELEFITALAEHASIAVERSRLYQAERENAERLRDLDRLKSEFVATVSHELRTPLTAVIGFTSTLRSRWPELTTEMRREFLDRLRDNARGLEHLITHLLDFGRLERGEFHLEPADHDMRELVDRIRQNMVHELESHEVVVDVPEGLVVHTDVHAFERIVGNLLSNAVKFSPPGTRIEVTGRGEEDGVALSVRDHGPGFPPAALPHVFERFYRGSEAKRGTGIGLAVVKDLAELHGGSVTARNASPGAEVTVRLARVHPAARTPSQQEPVGTEDGEAAPATQEARGSTLPR